MENQNWFAIEIRVESAASEAVEFALNELDSLGTEINNLRKEPNAPVDVIGYFNERLDDETVQRQLNEALSVYGFSSDAILHLGWREVENTDWLLEWKKHWRPTETAKFIIAPTWEKIEDAEKIVIYIEPSMAFGTGTHETTRLCLRAIEENFKNSMSLLDVGTGTGILVIAAAKFKNNRSPSKILACDTDAHSITIARENAELNDAAGDIEFYAGSINAETPVFDFVCANLTADVIVPLLSLLIEKTKQILVLSGILKEQENSVVDELRKYQISDFKIETDGEWISVLIENGKRKMEN